MADVWLQQTLNDGDITVENGVVALSAGLETAVYLSLFGGNEDDDGRPDNPRNWWGNLSETDLSRQYRSETQFLLQGLPATTGNLRRLEDAAVRDLAWLLTEQVASSVQVSAGIPAINRVRLLVVIEAQGEESRFAFVENWKASV